MPNLPNKSSVLQKQIPTILGLALLVVGLVAGVVFLGKGPGVFAPRASPQTTPKNIKISNVTDSGFSVSFLTDETTAGFVKYGKTASDLKSQASDDRDQLSGSVGKFSMHHVTVRGLDPATEYHFTLGTGSSSSFDNEGQPFTITTAKRGGTPSAAKTIYGSIVTAGGTPAEGSVVYVSAPGAGEMSSLVKSSGSWAIPLSNARTTDGSGYVQLQDTDSLVITVQGNSANQKAQVTTTVAQAQPAETITFGQTPATAEGKTEMKVANTSTTSAETAPKPSPSGVTLTNFGTTATSSAAVPSNASVSASPRPTPVGGSLSSLVSNTGKTASGSASPSPAASSSATLGGTQVASASGTVKVASGSATTVDLQKTIQPVITTTQPKITGVAAPGVKVRITVHSETQIEQELVADGNGGFTLDIAKLKEQLEPGEHTVTYSYEDPTTGKTVTKTQTFLVEPKTTTGTGGTTTSSTQVSPSPVPYGSGNPYPATSSASPSPSASSSGRVSYPATGSGIPVSGSVGTTLALLVMGVFFILAGSWSYWLAQQVVNDQEQELS